MLSVQELKSMNLKELSEELKKARHNALKTRIQVKTKHEKNTSKVNKIKVYIAQIKTFEKEILMEKKKKAIEKNLLNEESGSK